MNSTAWHLLHLLKVRVFLLLISFLFLANVSFGQDSALVAVDTAIGLYSQVDSTTAEVQANQQSKIVEKKRHLKKESNATGGLLFFSGLGIFLLFGLLRFFYNKHITALFTTLGKSPLFRLSANDRLWQSTSRQVLFLAVYFLSSGFIVGQIIEYYASDVGPLHRWFYGSALVFGAFLFKYLVLQSVALVFRFKKVADAYFKHIAVVNQVLGLILLPICGILLVLPSALCTIVVIISVIIFFIGLIFKFLINVAYVRNLSKVNYMHFIVYLCTLEFIPLAVFARYAYSLIGE